MQIDQEVLRSFELRNSAGSPRPTCLIQPMIAEKDCSDQVQSRRSLFANLFQAAQILLDCHLASIFAYSMSQSSTTPTPSPNASFE